MKRRNAKPRHQREREAKLRALEAIRKVRSGGSATISRAAKESGTSLATVKKYAGSALKQKCPGGKCQVSKSDRVTREMVMISPEGQISINAPGSRAASTIGRHDNAVKHYLATGFTSQLEPFKGKGIRVGKKVYWFSTDPDSLDKLWRDGKLEIEDIYKGDLAA